MHRHRPVCGGSCRILLARRWSLYYNREAVDLHASGQHNEMSPNYARCCSLGLSNFWKCPSNDCFHCRTVVGTCGFLYKANVEGSMREISRLQAHLLLAKRLGFRNLLQIYIDYPKKDGETRNSGLPGINVLSSLRKNFQKPDVAYEQLSIL